MVPLSVTIITKNEADRVGDTIRSVPFAAEILVLDSGSTDGTPEVARALGARVVETDWPGHVAQKTRAWSMVTQPWVLSLDGDEQLSPALAEEIQALLADPPADVAGFSIVRVNEYLGTRVRGGVFGPVRHLRLARREAGRWGGEDPHDQLEISGGVLPLRHPIIHRPYRSLSEHLDTIGRYSQRFVEVSQARGRRARLVDVLFRPPLHLLSSLIVRGGLRDGALGLSLAWLGAAHVALKWARLYAAGREGSSN